MLWMLNLFLWEKAASVPVSGYDGMSLHELLDDAMTESSNIKELTAEMHRIFVSISLIFGFFLQNGSSNQHSQSPIVYQKACVSRIR